MPVITTLDQGRFPVKVYTDEIEASARQQLLNLAQLPFIHGHVAAMPDVHAGIGATVGSVIPTRGAINCHHNYVARETHYGAEVYVTRKGAIRAGPENSASSPAAWGHAPTSCAARAAWSPSTPAPTVPGGA